MSDLDISIEIEKSLFFHGNFNFLVFRRATLCSFMSMLKETCTLKNTDVSAKEMGWRFNKNALLMLPFEDNLFLASKRIFTSVDFDANGI